MQRTTAARWVGVPIVLAVLGIGTIVLWPASEEEIQIEALASTDLNEVRRAADKLAASGSSAALGSLRDARRRLVDKMIDDGSRDLRQFGHLLNFDLMMRRVSDRRQSLAARRLWRALGAVTRAVAVLDPQAAETQRALREEWAGEWKEVTEEEWEEETPSATSSTPP